MKAEVLYKGSVIRTISNGETITLHCADKVLTGDVVVRVIADVKLISFTVEDTTYQAEEGMTWFEWVNSNYNTNGYYIVGSNIRISYSLAYEVSYDGVLVRSDESIIENRVYVLNYLGPGGNN